MYSFYISLEKDTYSWITGLFALIWTFWTYWSIGEMCSRRIFKSELLRVTATAVFLLKPRNCKKNYSTLRQFD